MPRGRPSKLNHVVRRDPTTGKNITVRQLICDWLRDGIPYDTSVFRANVGTSTVNGWLRRAAEIEERIAINPLAAQHLTRHEQDLLDFAHEVETARAEGEARHHEAMGFLAKGYRSTITTTTIKLDPLTDNIIEKQVVTRETVVPPSFAALRWRLENTYGRRAPTEVKVNNGVLADDEREAAAVEAIEAWLRDTTEGADHP